jgi:hypothetical protein
MFAAIIALAVVAPAHAQDAGGTSNGQTQNTSTPPTATQDDDPDADINLAQPDFTLAALPTTLRLPRYKSAFRVTHRFGRPLGSGNFGDLAGDLFGLDSGALIGLEYRFGILRKTQIGIHRTSGSKTIELFAQRELFSQSQGFFATIDALATIEGTDNMQDHHSPALGLVLSREVGEHAAFYLEPIWVNNTNPIPEELIDEDSSNSTFIIGLGTRVRIRPTVYLLLEASPRVGGYDPDVTQISFGIEKRAGGHTFQLNFSNGFGTTLAQIARGGTDNEDWYLGFNISRKFF